MKSSSLPLIDPRNRTALARMFILLATFSHHRQPAVPQTNSAPIRFIIIITIIDVVVLRGIPVVHVCVRVTVSRLLNIEERLVFIGLDVLLLPLLFLYRRVCYYYL